MISTMNEVADIFQEYGKSYREEVKLPAYMSKAMNAITSCRTSALRGAYSRV